MVRILVTAILIPWITVSTAFSADLNCKFTTECFEKEPCADADYEVRVSFVPKRISPDGYISRATLTDVSTTTRGMFAKSGENRVVISGDSNTGTETRTLIAPDGAARHVVMEGSAPMVIVYHGTCEDTE